MWTYVLGIIGLLLISCGVLLHKRRWQDELYTIGGFFLLAYSISVRDWIFIVLQVIFIGVAIYDLSKKSS